jgi:hypothetical protein|nr:MAG TPA: hypothetical protein [Caudoviricetes sp.]
MKIENINKAAFLCEKFEQAKQENEFLRDNFTLKVFMGKEQIQVSDEFLRKLRKDLIEENRKKREELRKQIEDL